MAIAVDTLILKSSALVLFVAVLMALPAVPHTPDSTAATAIAPRSPRINAELFMATICFAIIWHVIPIRIILVSVVIHTIATFHSTRPVSSNLNPFEVLLCYFLLYIVAILDPRESVLVSAFHVLLGWGRKLVYVLQEVCVYLVDSTSTTFA
jgi:hypothetical protein